MGAAVTADRPSLRMDDTRDICRACGSALDARAHCTNRACAGTTEPKCLGCGEKLAPDAQYLFCASCSDSNARTNHGAF